MNHTADLPSSITEPLPYTLDVLERLRRNAHLVKRGHFEAAKRRQRSHISVGLPVIALNVFLGSVFFTQLSSTLPSWCYWLGAVAALAAALLSGVQTFFNFKEQCDGHRELGNQYLVIARECERLIALYFDRQISLPDISERLEKLNHDYNAINTLAEKYIVTDKEHQRARANQDAKLIREPSLVMRKKAEQ